MQCGTFTGLRPVFGVFLINFGVVWYFNFAYRSVKTHFDSFRSVGQSVGQSASDENLPVLAMPILVSNLTLSPCVWPPVVYLSESSRFFLIRTDLDTPKATEGRDETQLATPFSCPDAYRRLGLSVLLLVSL